MELLSVSWDKPIDPNSLKIRARGYWEYIADLPHDAVQIVVRNLATAGRKWMPRPGELRVATIAMMQEDEMPPTAEEAWTSLLTISSAIHDGTTDYAKAHPVLAQTIHRLGSGAIGLHTNGDRDMFIRLYEQEREKYLLDRYGVKD